MNRNPKTIHHVLSISFAMQLGFVVMIFTLLGIGCGIFLDAQYQTSPLFLLLGVASSWFFIYLYCRAALKPIVVADTPKKSRKSHA